MSSEKSYQFIAILRVQSNPTNSQKSSLSLSLYIYICIDQARGSEYTNTLLAGTNTNFSRPEWAASSVRLKTILEREARKVVIPRVSAQEAAAGLGAVDSINYTFVAKRKKSKPKPTAKSKR